MVRVRSANTLSFRLVATAAIVVASLTVVGGQANAADWAGFRGPDAQGIAREGEIFPASEAIGLQVGWKIKIGHGYSGIAVVGESVVTAFAEGDRDVLACFDAASGQRRWTFDLEAIYKGHDGSHDGPIATPLIDGERVFMLGARGRLVGVSLKSGELIWSVDLVEEQKAKAPFYGFAASPIVVDGVLIVEVGAPDGGMVMGFDPTTGKKLWSAGTDDVAYQSPVVHEADGRRMVLAGGSKTVIALNAADGTVHWTHEHSGGGARGSGSMVPVSTAQNRVFLANKDDASTVLEWKPGQDNTEFSAAWEGRSIRNSYNVPVFFSGHLYAYSARFLTCVNAESGETTWKSREPGDGFLILVDGHLVLATKNGSVHVIRAMKENYQEAASVSVFDDVVWSHPSFANGRIYARSQSELSRIDVVRGKTTSATAAKAVDGILPDSKFGQFITSLSSETDKKAAIDQFMEKQESFPIVEGDRTVHYVYRGPGADLAVAGDMFGARQERRMHHVAGTDLFYYSMPVESDARLNYAFMRDYATIPDPNNPRTTIVTLVNDEMEMAMGNAETKMSWFAMPQWLEPAHVSAHAEAPSGRLESHELESEALGKKQKIEVYVPAGYEASATRYPTVYVFGGEEALKHGSFVQSLDRLCGHQVTPLIAVFVNEPSFRQQDKLAKMFGEELVPFVDKTYRTVDKASARAAVGAGFAGTDAWLCALKNPSLIGGIGAHSLFLFDSFSPDVKGLLKSSSEQPLNVYLDWGKYDFRNPHEAWDMGAKNRDIAEALKGKGYKVAGGEMNEGTGWPSWKNRTNRLLAAFFPVESK